jgi:hypothetical protein
MHFAHPGWDTDVYVAGMHSVHIGHDPYADATALQQLEHSRHPDTPDNLGPFSYVYSPITLPLLRLLGNIPLGASACLYFLCYIAGVLSELIVGASLIQPSERRYFLYWAPVAVFFPGIMVNDTVLSGNIAFILYGAALAAAACAWRGGSWRWFYLVVLIASCFKAPLLVLLAIPVFSARRQWVPAGLTGAAGVLLFALQPLIWPALFRNYLLAISLQFSLNRDFGSSPAGLFSGVLYDHHLPYSPASTLFYLLYALPLFAMLLLLSRRFLQGRFTLQQWVPVLLPGVILLNPRILEYDAAPLTMALTLLLWRFFRAFTSSRTALLLLAAIFLVGNVLTASHPISGWKTTEGPLLVFAFCAGVWTLLRIGSVDRTRLA